MVLFNETSVLFPGITGLVEKLTVVPPGLPLAERLIGVVNPPDEIVPSVIVIEAGAGQVAVAGGGLLNVNPVRGGTVAVHTPLP